MEAWRRLYRSPRVPGSPAPGAEYRSVVFTRRWIHEDPASYEAIYSRALRIARSRAEAFAIRAPSAASWIESQHWGTHQAGPKRYEFASISIAYGVGFAREGVPEANQGTLSKPSPSVADLAANRPPTTNEVYNDFDFEAERHRPLIFSYGEYSRTEEVESFAGALDAANELLASYYALLHSTEVPPRIVAREWLSSSHPTLAVAHLYFEP